MTDMSGHINPVNEHDCPDVMITEFGEFGAISSGTTKTGDLLDVCYYELRRLARLNGVELTAEQTEIGERMAEAYNHSDEGEEFFESETANEDLAAVIEALQDYAPEYGYFGANPGDPACFGFWLFGEVMQMVLDDGGLVTSWTNKGAKRPEDVPVDFSGYVLEINDHGNMTLYLYKGGYTRTVIWSVV